MPVYTRLLLDWICFCNKSSRTLLWILSVVAVADQHVGGSRPAQLLLRSKCRSITVHSIPLAALDGPQTKRLPFFGRFAGMRIDAVLCKFSLEIRQQISQIGVVVNKMTYVAANGICIASLMLGRPSGPTARIVLQSSVRCAKANHKRAHG